MRQQSEASPTGDHGENEREEDLPRDSCNSPVMRIGADVHKQTMFGVGPYARAGVIQSMFDS